MKPTENALVVLGKRYFLPGEDWDGLCHRVSREISQNNTEIEVEYFKAINDFYFLPNSPTLMNAGTSIQNLSACFVLPLNDSIESIMDTAKDMAKVFKSGGGVGIDLSHLRESGASVKETGGAASGVVSFMELYNTVANVVKQGGRRRAALMCVLRVDHPEILDFIRVKNDLTKLTNCNLSVAVTDEFIKAAIDHKKYNLISPVNGIVGQLDANKVLNEIAEYAWRNGEPGILFIDTINKNNPIPQFGKIEATNPCFAGDEKLLTREYGYIEFSELHKMHQDSQFHIINNFGVDEKATVTKTGVKETITLKLSNRETITCTKDHVFSSNGMSVVAAEMKGKIIDAPIKTSFEEYPAEYEFYGFIQGDGSLSRLKSERHLGLEVHIGEKDRDIIDYVNSKESILPKLFLEENERKIYLKNFNKEIEHVGFDGNVLPERCMPSEFNNWDNVKQLAFIRGCYSANGSIISGARISYKSTCRKFLEQMAEFLLSQGIDTYITTNKPKTVKFNNGEYMCRESYDLNITRAKSIFEFGMKIGFIQKYRQSALIDLIKKRACRVINISNSDKQDVYDFTCENHWGIVNGFVVHNCGEQPLLPYSACVLGSINLKQIESDEQLEYYTRLGVRFLNGVIQSGKFPLKQIDDMVNKLRQIGLGVMGWADYLAKRDIAYESKKARAIAEDMMAKIKSWANDESKKISLELGIFIDTTDGVRANGALLSIAPTGTISMIADCSSSIEPYFSLSYNKNVMDGVSLKYINDILIDKLKAENLWCSEVKSQILKTGSIQNIDTIPSNIKSVFKTANEISIHGHVKMQAAFQKHVDAGISKSVNMNANATKDDVLLTYLEAHRLGTKGITVYVDGSRSGQVLTSPKAKIEKCPECSSREISHDSGCVTCQSCGWSICST